MRLGRLSKTKGERIDSAHTVGTRRVKRVMRILQLHNRYTNPGGEDVVVEMERKILQSAGHEVEAFVAENQGGLVGAASMATSAWNIRSARRVAAVLQEHDPDVVHVHNTWFRLTSSVFSVLRRSNVPVVVTVHNYRHACLNGQLFRDNAICTLCVGRMPRPGVVRGCYRDSIPQSAVMAVAVGLGRVNDFWSDSVDRYVAMTSFERDLLIRVGLPAEKLVTKPHFVDDWGVRIKAPSESSTVLFVGRLSAEKGVRMLMEAWQLAEPTNLSLVVVGDGPLRQELVDRAPASVEFVGWESRERVAARTRDARAVLFPSRWYEPFGLVLIETMATGTPVIANRLGGLPEVLGIDEDSSALVGRDDVTSWANRIRDVDTGVVDVDELGAHGRSVFESRYTPTHGLRGLEDLYKSVLG